MIVDIDINKINDYIVELQDLFELCLEEQMNVFNHIKNICSSSWQDGNSISFYKDIKTEKESSDSFFSLIKKDESVFKQIYDEYKKIATKVYFCTQNKETIINIIDECINKINSALYNMNRINQSFYYYESRLINDQKYALGNILTKLKTIKGKIEDLYRNIKDCEDRIGVVVSKLTENNIFKFSFSFNSGGERKDGDNEINHVMFLKDIKILEELEKNEKLKCLEFFNKMNKCADFYNGFNTSLFRKKINSHYEDCCLMLSNREQYRDILREALERYNKTTKLIVDSKFDYEVNNDR